MITLAWVVVTASWVVWGYPFIFLAPHNQKRPSITAIAPTRIGLLLECLAIAIALACRLPADAPPGFWRLAAAIVISPFAPVLGWTAVRHLGRQFRVHAGLYEDHQLVTSGPYSVVRHPIYSSLFALLVSTLLVLTPWPWIAVSLALFLAGTEIRVYTEDRLLASRFGELFYSYQRRVRAYVPFVR